MRRWMLNPRWLALHALTVLLTVAFLGLGWWQLKRGESGNFRSYAYALEWPLFALFVVFMWWHVLTDARRPAGPDAGSEHDAAPDAPGTAPDASGDAPDAAPQPARRHGRGTGPVRSEPIREPALPRVLARLERRSAPAPTDEPDEQLAAYNRYLAGLHARDERQS